MKKTTYILIATIVLLAVFSFFCPIIFLKQNEGKTNKIVLATQHKTTTIKQPRFSGIEVSYTYGNSDTKIEIVESDTIPEPTITMDKSWDGNIDYSIKDGTLYISTTMQRIFSKDNHAYIVIPDDNATIATIIVPKGMLKAVTGQSASVILRNFKESELTLTDNWENVTMTDCSFKTLSIKN